MPSNDLYILPEAVQLIPVRELNEQAKSKFDYDDNDFVITFSNTRNTSKVIDCESACLLKEFRTPRSFVESVFRYSMLNKKKPDEILEESYTFLSRLRSEGFLILYNKDAPPANDSLLKPGHSFYAYEVVAKIQVLSDTEVYKIKKEDSFYALKILKKNGQTFSENFCNEIEILKSLDGKINPGLIETGEYTGHEYLITAWFDGISCDQAAEKYRNTGNPANVVELVDLSLTILAAYEYLHRQGIIHSDIHPRNILVSENKEVCIIDFGLSRMAEDKKYRYRGGIGFFYEPEYAHSILKNEPQPMSSFAGEQYALGAVIYLLVSGKQYQNFSYEKETLFRQIAYDMPLPFEKYDVYIEPEIELAII